MGTRTVGAALALVAVGCGSKSSTSTTSATVTWANSLCSSATTFTGTVRAAVSDLKAAPTKAGLQEALDSIQTATQDFADSVAKVLDPKGELQEAFSEASACGQ
jgi:hypothetical protein